MTRHLRPTIILVASLLSLAAASPTAQSAADNGDGITVRQDKGIFTVTATFEVPQSAGLAIAVLTDYDRIAHFMPDVSKSVVIERDAARTVVEQEAVAKLMMFSKRVHLVLDVQHEGSVIRFRDRCGQSFKRYEGSWRLTPSGTRTAITYELTAEPSFDVPGFILGRVLKRDAKRMIEGLRQEMARRARSSAS